MKINVSTIIATLCISIGLNPSFAQFKPEHYAFKGAVKSMILASSGKGKDIFKAELLFDRSGRIIKQAGPYSYVDENLYPKNKSGNPILVYTSQPKNPEQNSYQVNSYNTSAQQLIKAKISGGVVTDLENNTYRPGEEISRSFINGSEIYSETTTSTANVTIQFPKGMVPFEWDKNTSKRISKISTSYDGNPPTRERWLSFKLVEKGKPQNWVELEFDKSNADKGNWTRYINGKKVEERYISNLKDLSDFGHLYIYNKDGNLTSDTYGYFSKIAAGNFMQRKTMSYDERGNTLKVVSIANGKEDYRITYTYTYDQHNNWTSCVERFGDDSGTKYTRILTYYNATEPELNNSLTLSLYQKLHDQALKQTIVAENQYKKYQENKKRKDNTPIAAVDYRKMRSPNWKEFIPAGQALDTLSRGDLNKDGLEDIVVAFQPKKLLAHQRNSKRTLRILFKQADGNYRLAAESQNVIMPEDNGQTFFTGFQIEKGILIINHDYLRGYCSRKFRYQNGGFYLIGASSMTGDASYTESFDYNLSTGQYVDSYTNDDGDTNKTKSQTKKGIAKLESLPNLEQYEMFSIEAFGKSI